MSALDVIKLSLDCLFDIECKIHISNKLFLLFTIVLNFNTRKVLLINCEVFCFVHQLNCL